MRTSIPKCDRLFPARTLTGAHIARTGCATPATTRGLKVFQERFNVMKEQMPAPLCSCPFAPVPHDAGWCTPKLELGTAAWNTFERSTLPLWASTT